MTQPQIGIYGLGTMGAALALNMADNGIQVAVSNRSADAVSTFLDGAGPLARQIAGHDDLKSLVAALPTPRVLLAMIPSTTPMDDLLDDVIPLLDAGDTVIDAGNADFHDTRRRTERLKQHGLNFVGIGVSGGEYGARHGPSMMVGGSDESWQQMRPLLEPIAARFGDDPCVAHLGPDGAGHFVKTVHNGIEYADMQMIAEVYDLLSNGAGMSPRDVAQQFDTWNKGPLQSYLFEVTAAVLASSDPDTGKPMVDVIADSAGQKGTGRWSVIEAVRLGQSATTIEAAVAARAWSAENATRGLAASAFGNNRGSIRLSPDMLEKALLAVRVLEYAQGFRVLAAASQDFDWALDLRRVSAIWRAGCIIRAALLDDIAAAFHEDPPQGELLLAPRFAQTFGVGIPALREVVTTGIAAGFALPVLTAALGYFDSFRQARGTASVIQGQRDYFGRHGFGRIDRDGQHHGPWWDNNKKRL